MALPTPPLPPDAPRPPAHPTSAMSLLAALLDRSLHQMAEAAADARLFDRETIRAASDVWDNNLFPLFWAASTSDAGERERRATTVLRWMAAFGERRRGWMAEQAAIAGYDVEAHLPPAAPHPPGRDHLGHVMAPQHRITPRTVDELAPDYDLASATVRHLRVERAGTRLTAFLQLVVGRTFAVDAPAPPALLGVWLDDVTAVAFDLADAQGVVLTAGPGRTDVSLGPNGRLRAAGGEYRLDDRSWHLSAAGRRADAVTPPRTPRPGRPSGPPGGEPGPDARAAAVLLHHSMLELRSVRYAARADRVPVRTLCRAFSGAGAAILAAGSRRGTRHREAAFRDLIRTWADQGGPNAARWFSAVLEERAGRPDIIETSLPPDRPSPSIPSSTSAPPSHLGTTAATVLPPAPETAPRAALLMASWTAAHLDHRTERHATAQLQFALPPHGRDPSQAWRVRTVECVEPNSFHLRTEAFRGPGPFTRTGIPGSARTLDLHQGALLVTTTNGWSTSRS
ncbi:hypothetical protein [Streptomyces omiyaensis]|uniref:hypothetical protein n=1 Tax=Streptomyces omiyaensis TaxID=68247 RepID=UPI0016730833|nr:hypothetical protein [Streptomyces omiyaensis]